MSQPAAPADCFGKVLLVALEPSGFQNILFKSRMLHWTVRAPFKGFPTSEFGFGQTSMLACSGVPVAFRTTSFAEAWKIQFKISKFLSVKSRFGLAKQILETLRPKDAQPNESLIEYSVDEFLHQDDTSSSEHLRWDMGRGFDKEY